MNTFTALLDILLENPRRATDAAFADTSATAKEDQLQTESREDQETLPDTTWEQDTFGTAYVKMI